MVETFDSAVQNLNNRTFLMSVTLLPIKVMNTSVNVFNCYLFGVKITWGCIHEARLWYLSKLRSTSVIFVWESLLPKGFKPFSLNYLDMFEKI